ncbi:hypothetical protein LINPERHAP1_LOCUS31117 [Linum perenne]
MLISKQHKLYNHQHLRRLPRSIHVSRIP